MNELPVFSCYHCHGQTGNPHTCLDRRTVRRLAREGAAKAPVTLEVIGDQELFTYCDVDCWHGHEAAILSQLQLKSTYPADGSVVPCSRCGSPIVRATPHVVYTVTTMRLTDAPDAYIGEVLREDDFAVLCARCEEHDLLPTAQRAVEAERAQ
jgi:hypothetical protein